MSFRELFKQMKDMKHYAIASLATFLLGIFLGFSQSNHFLYYLQEQSAHLQGIVEGINKLDYSQWRLLFFIFANNVLVCLLMIYAGTFFGIIPLFTLLSNGLLLGYLAQKHVPDWGWTRFLLAVLPHGIIEIPAVILACAYGIKFGTLVAKMILFIPFPTKRASNSKQLLSMLRLSLPLTALLAVLLLTAAFVESMVTYGLQR